MPRAEGWRGSPTATSRREFLRLLREIRPTKRDTFYDLGCGYGLLCVWVADRVGLAVGIENFDFRYHRAVSNVAKSRKKNIRIVNSNFQRVPLKDATIVHCVILLGLNEYRKLERETSPGTLLALCYPPMYPIKSKRVAAGSYYLMKIPFSRVKDEREYARIIRRGATSVRDVRHAFPCRRDLKSLKWQISHADYVWKKLKKDR